MLRKLVFHHLVMRLIMPIWTLVPNFQVEYNTFFLDQDIPLLHGVTKCAPQNIIQVSIKEHLLMILVTRKVAM